MVSFFKNAKLLLRVLSRKLLTPEVRLSLTTQVKAIFQTDKKLTEVYHLTVSRQLDGTGIGRLGGRGGEYEVPPKTFI